MPTTQKKLINAPERLIEDLMEGMVSAHPKLLRIDGATRRAIVARNGPRRGKVGIVIGGGSGHEPAFAGYVGRGLADAAPVGNIFASPSPPQIVDAALAAERGAGTLFLYGNYAGDVMNFDMAAELLAERGITAQSFLVTDDIASAPADRIAERRGIAGDFFVFKVAGAAADLGLGLDAVEDAARRANDLTRTMGVALSACSMPQTGRANFDIPHGEMEVGMGIHGEPGVARVPVETADSVADRLLKPIVDELALATGDRVAVLVNGLGSTTLLEQYLLHRRVAETLAGLGIEIHQSWVGEYCTSLEMAGASVTVMKLDQDLQSWLDHPCETPALSVGLPSAGSVSPTDPARTGHGTSLTVEASMARVSDLAEDGDVTPTVFRAMLRQVASDIFSSVQHLCELDGAIGDGDHGITMEIGWRAIVRRLDALEDDLTISELSREIATAFLDAVGASAGPLYATGFLRAGEAVSDRLNLDAAATVAWLDGLAAGIRDRGKAETGDKTMLDAWEPAVAAARDTLARGCALSDCLASAVSAAEAGAAATREMQSRRGRSKALGVRSIGHVDPGAASAVIILKGMAKALSTPN